MKRLPYIIGILLLSQPLYADTKTTGLLQLLKPTTNYVDTKRTAGDKLNSDFDIIDASFTNINSSFGVLNSQLNSKVNFLANTLTTTTAKIDEINVWLGTNSAENNKFANFGSTLGVTIEGFKATFSTSDAQQTKFQNFGATAGTTTEGFKAQFSTNNAEHEGFKAWFATNTLENTLIANFFSTHSTLNDNQSRALGTATVEAQNYYTSNNASTGAISLNVSTVAYTAWQANISQASHSVTNDNQNLWLSSQTAEVTKVANFLSTHSTHQDATLNFLSTAGAQMVAVNNFLSTHSTHQDATLNFLSTGDVRDVAFLAFESTSDAQQTKFVNFRTTTDASMVTATAYKMASVYLSSSGALSTQGDLQGSYTTNFINALERLGAAGLTNSTTAQGRIIMGQGLYVIQNATIPAGVTVECPKGSSVVFTNGNTNKNILKVYGRLLNCYIDLQGNAAYGEPVMTGNNGTIDGLETYGAWNKPQTDYTGSILAVVDSTNVRVNMTIRDGSPTAQDGNGGGIMRIENSSNSYISVNIKTLSAFGTTGKQGIYLKGSNNIHFVDSEWRAMGGRFITFKENGAIYFENMKFYIDQAYDAGGVIWISNVNAGLASTRTVINNCDFFHNVADTDPIIGTLKGAGGSHDDLLVTNNRAYALTASAPTFVSVGAGSRASVLKNNDVYKMSLIIDAATAGDTQYTVLGNMKNSKEQ